jgi:hypothetical protein
VSLLNLRSYGIFSPSLRQNCTFRDLFNLLSSLEPELRAKYVPVIAETRERAYTVSPTLAQIKPFLEGSALDEMGKDEAHHRLNRYDPNKREFFVSNFEFALAQAIFLAGNSSGRRFIDFCSQAASEIRSAVREGKIEAGRKGFGLVPPFEMREVPGMIIGALRSGGLLLNVSTFRVDDGPTPKIQQEIISWFAITRTWPSTGSLNTIRSFFFRVMVVILQLSYVIGICFFLITVFWLAKRRLYMWDKDLVLVQMTAGVSCIFWCMAMGVVDTVGFPILQWSQGYNILGFYPLQFFLCMTVFYFAYFLCNRNFIHRKRDGEDEERA